MRKNIGGIMGRKLLCLALSIAMVTGNAAPAVLAADTKAVKETSSAPQLTCETKTLKLPDSGRSIDVKLCLTQEDSLIQQKIFTEDITLGGVFRNMEVEDVRNDHKTILLDLNGVPELTGAETGALLQGTVEFPGFLFDCDESVTASVDVIKAEGKAAEVRPYIYPHLDGFRVDGDKAEMIIVLLPMLGEFAEDFSAEDISFGQDLSEAKIRKGRKSEDGNYEFIAEVPVTAMDVDDGYSCFGGFILNENSMISPDGKLYGKKVYAAEQFSKDLAGRDLSQNDVNTIKSIVGGYGNTTAGTITGVLSGAGTAFTVGSTILGLAGVLPTDASRHKELLKALENIQNNLYYIEEKCDYMSGVLDVHTRMLSKLKTDLYTLYIANFDRELDDLKDEINQLDRYLQKPEVQEQIDEILLKLCEKYQVPQPKPKSKERKPGAAAGRDIDEDLVVNDPEYYEYDYEVEEGGYAEDAMAFDELLATGMLFEDDNEAVLLPDAISPEGDLYSGAGMKEMEASGEVHPAQEAAIAVDGQPSQAEPAAVEEEPSQAEPAAAEKETKEETKEEERKAAKTQADEEESKAAEAQAETEAEEEERKAAETEAEEKEPEAAETQAEEKEPEAAETQAEEKEPEAAETQAEEKEPEAAETQAEEKEPEAAETQAEEKEPEAAETQAEEKEPEAAETQAEEKEPEAAETQAEEKEPEAAETQAEEKEPEAAETQAEEKEPEAAETQAEEKEPEAAKEEDKETEAAEEEDKETEAAEEEDKETEAAEEETEEEETEKMEAASADEDQETEADEKQNVETETRPVETEPLTDQTDAESEEAEMKAAQTDPAETENSSEADEIETEGSSEEETEAETETETETEVDVTAGRKLEEEWERRQFLVELTQAIGQIQASTSDKISDSLGRIKKHYTNLKNYLNKEDITNPIVAYCLCEDSTNNFATTGLPEKEMYKANIQYLFARALNYLVTLEDLDKEEELKAFNAQIATVDENGKPKQDEWVQVDEVGQPARDENGNPYCSTMGGYVRLATPDEMEAFIAPLNNSGKEKEIFIYNRSDVKPVKVYGSDFVERMHGRSLEEELERAGIQNLEAVRNSDLVSDQKMQGIMFNLERWGMKRSKVHLDRDDFPYKMYVGGNTGGHYVYKCDLCDYGLDESYMSDFPKNDDYVMVTTDCINWNKSNSGYSCVVYQSFQKPYNHSWHRPYTFLVVVK